MDRALVSSIAHQWHPVAAPVSDDTVRRLVRRLEVPPDGRVLDLGCGSGEWLRAAVGPVATTEGVGVDTSPEALEVARDRTRRRALDERIRFEQADAATWEGGRFDVVLCVGATHALGGLAGALTAIRRHLRPGGCVLLGEGFWERTPSPEALGALGELPSLPELVDEVSRQDLEPGYGHVSTSAEWDDYEWSWTGALTEWALSDAAGDDRAEALGLARAHRRQWLAGYRGELGFLTVVLHDLRGR